MIKRCSLIGLLLSTILLTSCEKDEVATLPVVSTTTPTSVTTTGAISGGAIISDGGATITTSGVCWSNNPEPKISDSKTSDNKDVGQFVSTITGLNPGSTYHIRAYATNEIGTAYGADIVFSTSGGKPSGITLPVCCVTSYDATLNGIVNAGDLSTTVTFEWGLNASYGKTVNAAESPFLGSVSSSASAQITDLTPGTLYHFRIVVENSLGKTYGNDCTFTTVSLPITNGLIAYYPFNGNAKDESGNARHGTVVNAILSVDRFGKTNSAYEFDGSMGTERYIYSHIGENHTITFCIWFKSPHPDTMYPIMISYGTDRRMQIQIDGDSPDYIRNGTYGCVGAGSVITTFNWAAGVNTMPKRFDDNRWHFLVTSFLPNDGLYVYIDNVLVASDDFAENPPSDDLLYIGRQIDDFSGDVWHETHFHGSLDDVRIFNRKLTGTEMEYLFKEGGFSGQ